jgi:hypothetical protein
MRAAASSSACNSLREEDRPFSVSGEPCIRCLSQTADAP